VATWCTVGYCTNTGKVISTPVCFQSKNVNLIAENDVPPSIKKLSSLPTGWMSML
jgi:hypothetical protein